MVCDGSDAEPVSAIDLATRMEVDTESLAGGNCTSVDVCADGTILAASSLGVTLLHRLTIDASCNMTNTGDTIDIGANPNNVNCAPGSASAVVTTREEADVRSYTITPSLAGAVSTEALTGGFGLSAVINSAGNVLYARSNPGQIDAFSYDQTLGVIGASLGGFPQPIGFALPAFGMDQMALHPDEPKLYAPQQDSVQVFDAATGAFITSITGANIVFPSGICFRPGSVDEEVEVVFLIIDEDTIDNGIGSIESISFDSPDCGDGDPSVCVNDDIADPGVRDILFTRGGTDITPFSGLVLPTGEVEDEGLFQFTNSGSQSSQQDDSISFTIQEFIFAVAGSDAADENNLDKVNGVVPLGADDIVALKDKTVCAVVYDSDVSADVKDGYASLKGATTGLTAFTVTAVGPDPDGPDGSVLPSITVDLLPSADVPGACAGAE